MGVYGIALAGWSSNNKYSLLGGLRASAQMVSYEVAMGLSLIPVVLITGNVSFHEIIARQQAGLWFVLPLFLSFFMFLVSAFAETNRVPFDLPEAESELIAGYHTEYSAMKFSLFFIAEYANMITASAMMVVLFFGGWDLPGHWDEAGGLLQTLVTGLVMFLKTFFFLFVFIWVRWTLPRFRYDQLMSLGWKVLMPIGLAYVMLVGLGIYGVDTLLSGSSPTVKMGVLFLLNLPLMFLVFLVLDRGRLVSGSAARRAPAPRVNARCGGGGMTIGVKVLKRPEAAGQLRPGGAQGHGAHLQEALRAQGDDGVPGGRRAPRTTRSPRAGAALTGCSPTSKAGRSASRADSVPRFARPIASSWCPARTRRGTGTR